MNLLRRILSLSRRSELDREIDEELGSHLQMRTEDNIAAGMSASAAARDARLRFGNPTSIKERAEGMDVAVGVESVWQDLRYALRGYIKSPIFTLVAIATLALGIGANTAIFQLLDAVRLRSLPVAKPQELAEVKIVGGYRGFGVTDSRYAELTQPVWEEIRRHHEPFSGVFAWFSTDRLVGPLTDSRRIHSLDVSGEFFSTLGVQPSQGRLLQPEDEAIACTSPRVVLSYPFWQSEMGGRALTSGSTMVIDGQPLEIVGVASPRFSGLIVGEGFDLAMPLCLPHDVRREVFDVSVIGRLKPDWSMKRASGYFGSLSAGIFDATAPTGYSSEAVKQSKDFKLGVYPASGGVSGLRDEYNRSLWLLLGITGLVLLIACANLANLMLARSNARGREMALRVALGASRSRLLRQLLIESSALAIVGTALGVSLAQAFSRILLWSLSTKAYTVQLSVTTDWRVLCFAAALAAITCAVFGSVPALRASRSNPVQAMKSGDGRVAGSRESFSVQRLMVTTQISVSMVLLVGAFLFVHSFRNLLTYDPGVKRSGITLARFGYFLLHVDRNHYAEFDHQLLTDVRAVPGVRNAATTRWVPLTMGSWTHQVHSGAVEAPSKFTWVSPGFLQTMGISLFKGRDFSDQDTAASPHVAIVNQAFVRKFMEGTNPIGQTLRTLPEPNYPETTFEIIGTIADTKYSDIRGETPPMAFAPSLQFPVAASAPWVNIVIDSSMPSESIAAAIKGKVKQKYPAVIVQTFDLEASIHDGLLQERLMAILSGFFGLLAAILVMVGLYGLMSYLVTLRRNEIGIRIALGSQRWQVVRLVMRDAAGMLIVGVGLGTVLSLIAGRTVSSMLFGLKPYDVETVASAILLLAVVASVASFLPARKASKLDPMAALRCE